MATRWWCGVVRVCFSPELRVNVEKVREWWVKKGTKLVRLRRSIRIDVKECSKKRGAGAKQLPLTVIVQTFLRESFIGFKSSNRNQREPDRMDLMDK